MHHTWTATLVPHDVQAGNASCRLLFHVDVIPVAAEPRILHVMRMGYNIINQCHQSGMSVTARPPLCSRQPKETPAQEVPYGWG